MFSRWPFEFLQSVILQRAIFPNVLKDKNGKPKKYIKIE